MLNWGLLNPVLESCQVTKSKQENMDNYHQVQRFTGHVPLKENRGNMRDSLLWVWQEIVCKIELPGTLPNNDL